MLAYKEERKKVLTRQTTFDGFYLERSKTTKKKPHVWLFFSVDSLSLMRKNNNNFFTRALIIFV